MSHPKIIERRPNNAPSLSNVLAVAIAELHDMLLRCPVNTDEPSSFFVHHALPSNRRAMRGPIDRACVRTSHRNLIRSLYWRSKARSPHCLGFENRILRRRSRPAFLHSQDPQLTINRATTFCADAVTLPPSRHHAPSATLTSSACCAVS